MQLVRLETGSTVMLQTAPPAVAERGAGYQIIGRDTADVLRNKDLADATNNVGFRAHTPYTVSADPALRGRHRTISAALAEAAANRGPDETKNITIAPGIYTENITVPPYVNIVGAGTATTGSTSGSVIVRGVLGISGGGMTIIDNVVVESPAAAFMVTSPVYLVCKRCIFNSAIPPVVNSMIAIVRMEDCTVDGVSGVLNVASCFAASFTRCVFGNGFAAKTLTFGSVNATLDHCTVTCALHTSVSTTASYTRFAGGDETRVVISGGDFTARYCTFESPASDGACIAGSGNFNNTACSFSGRNLVTARTFYGEDPSQFGRYEPAVAGVGVSALNVVGARYSRVGTVVSVSVTFTFTSSPGVTPVVFVSLPVTRCTLCR